MTKKQTPKDRKMAKPHSQKQSQKQVVNVRIGSDLVEKKRRRRAPRKKRQSVDVEALDYLQPQQLAPTIIMQTGYGSPTSGMGSSIMNTPVAGMRNIGQITGMPTPSMGTVPTLEDIGQIGTEGPVEILERPTKAETLSELIEPVPTVSMTDNIFTTYTPPDPSRGINIESPMSIFSEITTEPPRRIRQPREVSGGFTKTQLVIRYKELTGRNPPKGIKKQELLENVLSLEEGELRSP